MIGVPVLLERQVRATFVRSRNARNRLADLMRSRVLEVDGSYSWGQWLDGSRNHRQSGIYGTAAGVEVLSMAGDPVDHPPIASALAGLPFVGDGAAYEPEDQDLVFKVIAVVEACAATQERLDLAHPAVSKLVGMRIDDRGWCGYKSMPDRVQEPSPALTARALSALSSVSGWRDQDACRSSLLWLADRLHAGTTDAVDDALGLLALNLYRDIGFEDARWKRGQVAAQERVGEMVQRLVRSGRSDAKEPFDYEVNLHKPENKYMFFLPGVVGALALLHGLEDKPVHAGAAVARLVDRLARTIDRAGGFVSQGRRLATTDQLWVDRLLRRFEHVAAKPVRLVPRAAGILLGRRRRWIVVPVLTAIAWIGILLAANQPLTPTQVIAALASGVAANLLPTVLLREGGS